MPGGAIASRAPTSTASSPRRRRRPSARLDPGGTSGATPTQGDEEVAVTIDGGGALEAAAGLRPTGRPTGPASTSSPVPIAAMARGAAIPTATA